jgi:dolichol-phosphate mannosyltransferase
MTELVRFCVVGASGYVVNLAVFSSLLAAGMPLSSAAVGAFLVAVTNNYVLNRAWTFATRRGDVVVQGARYLTVSLATLAANLVVLHVLAFAGVAEVPAQAAAIVVVTPLSFLGNRLWSFGS